MEQDKLHINSGMKVPETYFDDFEKNLKNRIDIEFIITKEQGFKIPEAYFEQSRESILKFTTRKTKTFYLPIVRHAVASVLILIVVSSIWIYISRNSLESVQFSDLTSLEIQNYLNDIYLEDDKTYLILEQLEAVSLNNSIVNESQNMENLGNYLQEYDYNIEENY
ncbi:hypothetical protein [Capnocytophaga felis]|uniref:Uncharacterized protein n=1 Tax=Capnocytophaga felis TaxID=2267611 RepID=A0A5M4BBE6_9FLAO|nr:hypothetical protein [Capnocytophaga felis]GET46889.1 hypothetical protein RCZ01_21910 [Capnocytophaga felis]GET48591.1 hypothetical protein RCZ02_14220 [Capnocytophaga felis]